MDPKTTVGDFMAREVISVKPETSLLEAADLLFKKNLTGLPVIDASRRVVGILTEYDLITKGSAVHLPTFLKLLKDFKVYRKDKPLIKDELKKILTLKVKDVMNPEPLLLYPETSLEEAVRTFGEHHKVNPIPIVNNAHQLVGILSRFDIIKLYAGTTPHPARSKGSPEPADRAVNEFIEDFGGRFVAVSRARTRVWFWVSATFLIAGILIALFLMLQIEPNF